MLTLTTLLLAVLLPTPLRQAAEANMALHMLVHLPAVAGAGALLALRLPRRAHQRYARVDGLGAGSLTLVLCVMAFWMLPVALDASLLSPAMAAAKYASLLAAGAALASAWRRMPAALQLFLLGNGAWMLATVGLVFRETETRLCANYLLDQQALTGNGLVAWGLLAAGLALWTALGLDTAPEST